MRSDEILNYLTIALISISLFIILFLIFRFIILWYWKINKRIELLEKNNSLLNKIHSELVKANKLEANNNKNL